MWLSHVIGTKEQQVGLLPGGWCSAQNIEVLHRRYALKVFKIKNKNFE